MNNNSSNDFNLNSTKAFEKFIEQGIYKLISPEEFKLPKTKMRLALNNFPSLNQMSLKKL